MNATFQIASSFPLFRRFHTLGLVPVLLYERMTGRKEILVSRMDQQTRVAFDNI